MMKKINLLSAIAALSIAGSAVAADMGKFYFKGGVGYDVSHGKVKFESQGWKPTATGSPATYGPPMVVSGTVLKGESSNNGNFKGAVLSAGVGYNVTDAFRTDLAFDYKFKQKRKFNIAKDTYLNPNQTGKAGNEAPDLKNDELLNQEISRQSWTLMMNVYYDFLNTSDFTPFVNAGLGYGYTKNKGLIDTSAAAPNNKKNVDSIVKGKSHFAWDVGAGIAYKISDGVYTDLAYKLVGMTAESEFKDKDAFKKADVPKATVKMKTPDISHSVNFGLRLEF